MIILKGVTIGTNSVIGANSVVVSDIPENVVAGGNPCQIIRKQSLEEIIKEIEDTGNSALVHVVKDSNEDLRKVAEIYGKQVALLFHALANDRVKSIENASKIEDFNVHATAKTNTENKPETEEEVVDKNP